MNKQPFPPEPPPTRYVNDSIRPEGLPPMKPSFLLLMLCVLSILVAGISHDFGMGGVSVAFGVIAGVFGFASFCVYLNEIGKGRK